MVADSNGGPAGVRDVVPVLRIDGALRVEQSFQPQEEAPDRSLRFYVPSAHQGQIPGSDRLLRRALASDQPGAPRNQSDGPTQAGFHGLHPQQTADDTAHKRQPFSACLESHHETSNDSQ